MSKNLQLPDGKGAYALLFSLPVSAHLKIGRLGEFDFPLGNQVYLGSGFGSGGLAARLRHHFTHLALPHWHVDFLHPAARLLGAAWVITDQRLECAWARKLTGLPGAYIPAPGFGASDCRQGCASHLVGFGFDLTLTALAEVLQCEKLFVQS